MERRQFFNLQSTKDLHKKPGVAMRYGGNELGGTNSGQYTQFTNAVAL